MRYKLVLFLTLFLWAGKASAANPSCFVESTFNCSNRVNYSEAIFPTSDEACGPAGSAAVDTSAIVCCCPTNTATVNASGTLENTSSLAITTPDNTKEKKPIKILSPLDNLQIKIPGLEKISEKYPATCTDTDSGVNCELPFLAVYITALYNYAMGIIGILAAIALMIGGSLYLVSAGNASRITQAKNWIGGAITGLIIMTTSYILLNEINPELVGLKPLELKILQEITANEGADLDVPMILANSDGNCGVIYASIGALPNITYSGVSGRFLDVAGSQRLKELSDAAQKSNIKLTLKSAGRTFETQKLLWENCLKTKDEKTCKKLVAPPSCSATHILGIAIDLCITGSKSCDNMGGKHANYRDCDTWRLEEFMKDNGWFRYCGEWWHFEHKNAGLPNRAGKGQTCSGPPQPNNCTK